MVSKPSTTKNENPRILVEFTDKRTQQVYRMISGRVMAYEKQIEKLEEQDNQTKVVDLISKIEELEFVILHLKRNFKFKELD